MKWRLFRLAVFLIGVCGLLLFAMSFVVAGMDGAARTFGSD